MSGVWVWVWVRVQACTCVCICVYLCMHVCVEVQTGEYRGMCVEVTGQSQVLTPTLLEKNLFDVCPWIHQESWPIALWYSSVSISHLL